MGDLLCVARTSARAMSDRCPPEREEAGSGEGSRVEERVKERPSVEGVSVANKVGYREDKILLSLRLTYLTVLLKH